MTIKFCIIWTEFRPATALVTIMSENYISYALTNLSAGQSWTTPAKTTCANQTSQFFVTGQNSFRFDNWTITHQTIYQDPGSVTI
jgi:hypothetical protein